MNVNPESNEQDNNLNEDIINKLESGEMDFGSLSENQMNQILSGEGQSEPTRVESEVQQTTTQPEEQQPKSIIESKKPQTLQEKYHYKSALANRANQLLENEKAKREEHERKLIEDPRYRQEYFEKLGISDTKHEVKIDPDKDYFSEDYLSKIDHLERRLESYEEKMRREEREREAKRKVQKAEEDFRKTVLQIEELQNEYPELKTKKPFSKLNKEYVAWYESVGKQKADKYVSDQEFKRQMDEQGLGAPKELDKLEKLYSIHNRYKEYNYPTYRSAFRDSDLYDEITSQKVNSIVQDADDLLDSKLKQFEQMPKTVNHNSTLNQLDGQGTGMSEESMINWLEANPAPSSVEDKAIQQKIYKTLGII